MRKMSNAGSDVIKIRVWGLDQVVDRFYSYSALNHIIVKKTYAFNIISISHILNNRNSAKSTGKSKIAIYVFSYTAYNSIE